jgi:single-strand DNA-binding protein
MAGEPTITVTGNLGTDAEFRKTPNGTPVTSFNIANTPRKNKMGVWEDQETNWFRVFVWEEAAAGTAITFKKGDKIVVTGRLTVNRYETKEGEARQSLEINADTVGLVPKKSPEPTNITEVKFGEDQVPSDDFPW